MRKLLIIGLLIGTMTTSFAQKKVLNHKDFDIWNVIKNQTISNDGNFIMYSLEKGEKDNFLKIKDDSGKLIFSHERAERGQFTNDSKFAFFTVKAWKDSVNEMKRRKVKKNKMPKDTLAILNLTTNSITKFANLKSYKSPKDWAGFIALQIEEDFKKLEKKKDTLKKKKKTKKVGKDNGYPLVVSDLNSGENEKFQFVTNYSFAKKGKKLAFSTTGDEKDFKAGVYIYDLDSKQLKSVFNSEKGKYFQLNFSDSGDKLGFVVDKDSTKAQIRPNELYLWKNGENEAKKMLDSKTAPNGYLVSSNGTLSFSKDESKMYFGLAKPPIVKDTTLIDSEIVNVEVWTYDEPRLYTVQEKQIARDKKKSFQTVINLSNNKLVQLGTEEYASTQLINEGNSENALVSNSIPYQLESQWKGNTASDYAIVSTSNGTVNPILTNITGRLRTSPKGNYVFGYNSVDKTWITYSISANKLVELTKNEIFYDELNDSPRDPSSYGAAGWTKNDDAILLYDRFDIWKVNPKTGDKNRITKGRENNTVFRYVRLDNEERFINEKENLLLSTFNEITKESGYYSLNLKNGKGKQLLEGPYSYSRPIKAQKGENVLFTRESFTEFPNLRVSTLNFKKETVISDANPQQKEYNWGTAELVNWNSLDGMELTGMLIKPENFDPNKKYPMLVNFYEKSSNGLYRHKAPSPGRSSINYSFYTSRGYVIFNPDIYYRVGYPGESAFNCVIPGITSMVEKGFIDKDNIGTQGHSWGGYQIAYLVTKTDIFKAAESGAPVVNMISAFGGIRWDSGLSRQFQYEHTQSRIGGTPWEYPQRYYENSPIYNLDKVNTPLLIMHNDADGHVPWYQGIEFFVGLRRLGKPSWMLNYNGARHWPLKLQNRKDFNIRMAQFFDHYLKGAPKPVWMERGVPAIEKGINQGLELIEN